MSLHLLSSNARQGICLRRASTTKQSRWRRGEDGERDGQKISKFDSTGRRRRKPTRDRISITRRAPKCMTGAVDMWQDHVTRHRGNNCPVAAASIWEIAQIALVYAELFKYRPTAVWTFGTPPKQRNFFGRNRIFAGGAILDPKISVQINLSVWKTLTFRLWRKRKY